MADFNIEVYANALMPAAIYAGNEGTVGKTIGFNFSDDWNDFIKEIIFYDMRGNAIMVPCVDGAEIAIPAELAMYGGAHKFTVRGFTLDENDYIDQSLQVTGTIFTTYTAGHNPRMEGKIIPSTLDLFVAQANEAMHQWMTWAKESGEFDGENAGYGTITATTETLNAGEEAEVLINTSGPDTAKNFSFLFRIPAGDSGVWVSDSLDVPPSGDQNLWVLTESGDNFLYIPDSLIQEEDGLIYLSADGEKMGSGIYIKGDPGKNFTLLGHYNTYSSLVNSVPNPEIGDAYGVGVTPPYNVYVWDQNGWANYGPIGPGSSGGVVDTSMSSTSTNAVQNRVIKAYVDNLIGDVDSAISAINAIVGS